MLRRTGKFHGLKNGTRRPSRSSTHSTSRGSHLPLIAFDFIYFNAVRDIDDIRKPRMADSRTLAKYVVYWTGNDDEQEQW